MLRVEKLRRRGGWLNGRTSVRWCERKRVGGGGILANDSTTNLWFFSSRFDFLSFGFLISKCWGCGTAAAGSSSWMDKHSQVELIVWVVSLINLWCWQKAKVEDFFFLFWRGGGGGWKKRMAVTSQWVKPVVICCIVPSKGVFTNSMPSPRLQPAQVKARTTSVFLFLMCLSRQVLAFTLALPVVWKASLVNLTCPRNYKKKNPLTVQKEQTSWLPLRRIPPTAFFSILVLTYVFITLFFFIYFLNLVWCVCLFFILLYLIAHNLANVKCAAVWLVQPFKHEPGKYRPRFL